MMHQASSDQPILLPEVFEPETGDGGSDSAGTGGFGDESYGGGGFGPTDGCGPLVSSALSVRLGDGVPHGIRLAGSTLAVDAAWAPDGTAIAVAVAGQHDAEQPTMQRVRGIALVDAATAATGGEECFDPEDVPVPGQVVSVAFSPNGDLVAQSREPAELYRVNLQTREVQTIALTGDSRRDTGHDLFHQDAGVGIACASCHPEGGDDGRVWNFVPLGPRRSQPLRVGLAGSEPFHWDGDMDDFDMLAREVHEHRMGGPMQSDERLVAFRDWLFALEPMAAADVADPALVERGRDLFVASACTSCHIGDAMTNNETVAVRGVSLQVPSLRGVALRPPYMHDGRATNLEDAVYDMLEATASDVEVTDEDVDAIVAYLRTL
jgi:mono/diheme cytochrome c family protein